jgi:hypothetical protein
MATPKIRVLVDAILALTEAERQEPAREILPSLLGTRAGLEHIDEALRGLSDDELDALVMRARRRASILSEHDVAAIIAEGLRAAREGYPARSLNRWILPVAVFGSSGTKSIQRGYL